MPDSQVNSVERKVRQPGRRRDRVVLQLGPGCSITIVGAEPTVEGLIEVLEEALSKARKARQMKLGLKTFVSMLKDQLEA